MFINKMVFGKELVVEPGHTGLKPIGASCYMNSILQVYSNTRLVYNFYLINQNIDFPSEKYTVSINNALKKVLEKLWSGAYKNITPTELRRTINSISFDYRNNLHHDIQEFCINLNHWIDSELLRIAGKSLIDEMFNGTVGSQLTCNKCPYNSTVLEKFAFLNLPISNESCSLQDCFTKYLEKEHIPDAKCSSCNEGSYYRAYHLKQIPVNLVITLKRFSFGPNETGEYIMIKNNVPVKYEDKLTVNNYTYYLYAIISHTGTLDAGHYYAVVRNLRTGKWLKYDDQIVVNAAADDLQESKYVYMLFYNREDEEHNVHMQFQYENKYFI